ncbi:MAG TPA: cbb3-type cytochrome c oxidase subunit I [Gemmatimonadaceae bacterium]|nr:cbb3-type cytochrome c oxidase subunit I [Gemmatimonadaceae bacterium]
MHSLVRRYLKTGIGFLLLGLVLGGWMLVERELLGRYPGPYITSAHTHAILVGFVMMMILGVALWLFPRPEKGDERYRPEMADAAYWLIAVGTLGRVVGELLRQASAAPALRWGVVLFGLAQIAGVALFFHTMWPRIRPVGSQVREAKGERF